MTGELALQELKRLESEQQARERMGAALVAEAYRKATDVRDAFEDEGGHVHAWKDQVTGRRFCQLVLNGERVALASTEQSSADAEAMAFQNLMNGMSNATAKQIESVLGAQGLHTIGALVFWTLSGVRIARDELASSLDELGLGAAMVRKPTPAGALAEAVKRVGMGRKGLLFRQMKREWALVAERGEGKTLRLSHVATFRCVANGLEGVEVEELARFEETANLKLAVEAQYREVLDFAHSADLSAVLCSAMQGVGSDAMLGGLSLRQSTGGLYYVSAAKLDLLKRFVAMVNDRAPASSVEVLTLTGDSENLETAARNVRGSITTQLKQTREEIREFVQQLKDKGNSARRDSIVVRAEQFKQLRGKVELFADVLGESMAELQAQIETARAELIGELEAA